MAEPRENYGDAVRVHFWKTARLVATLTVISLVGLVCLAALISAEGDYADDVAGLSFFFLAGAVILDAVTITALVRHRRNAPRQRLLEVSVQELVHRPRDEQPAVTSWAYEPLRRLREAEESLAELLELLGADDGVPTGPVREAREAARSAGTVMRVLATRLQALERARDAATSEQAADLTASIMTLHGRLSARLTAFGRLLAAAGEAVAASSTGGADLTEATDNLSALAAALRELTPPVA
ncbi:phage shock envelope stress response protein PspM [Actinokineospora enzanensis]|uniref:phage shock envelope stress response protein PspM n=1 Tax=Actinokineospora enzanensis TaxID=155975 RepID=UPI0003AB1C41|nr:hypothetical protein [Actinokineospora enzanensis]